MSDLTFPVQGIPEPGRAIEVACGVKWLRMPLFMKLNHINLYLIKDDDGWFIVDTGLAGEKTQEYWEQVFASELEGLPVKGVIVTHLHPDHVGQAGWLTKRWDIDLWMTRSEYFATRIYQESSSSKSEDWERFYRRSGIGDDAIQQMNKGTKGVSKLVEPLPKSFRRLQDGDVITIAGRDWKVIVGTGHSPEHACLFCEELGVLISGDQVLPDITPNVSVDSIEPEADALRGFLDSQRTLLKLPETTLTLPAHNEPFSGLHTRLHYMIDHHEQSLTALEEQCRQPRSAFDLLDVLYKRELIGFELMLGIGECVAHLNCLINRGKLNRTLIDDIYYYQAA